MRLGSWLEISEDDGYNLEMIKTRLMVPNPEYISRMQQGFSTAGLHRFDPLFETGYRDGKKVIRVPRGLVNKYGKGKDIIDEREEGKKVDFKFKLKLGPTEDREEDQVDFVDAVVKATEKRTGAIGQASPGYGKSLRMDATLWTEHGPIQMKDVVVGSRIYGKDGKLHNVVGVYPQGELDSYKVTFSDGSSIECCMEHLWTVQHTKDRRKGTGKWETMSLKEIVQKGLLEKDGHKRWYIPMTEAIEFPKKTLDVDPYVLGCLIADGCFVGTSVRFSSSEEDIQTKFLNKLPEGCSLSPSGNGKDWYVTGFMPYARKLGLDWKRSYEKSVPKDYKYASKEDRLSLLQGLFDCDGSVTCKGKQLEYSTTSEQLAKDVQFLVESLGGSARLTSRTTTYTYKEEKHDGRISYRLFVKMPVGIMPFTSEKHAKRYKVTGKYPVCRSIVSVEPAGRHEMQCIAIDSEDSLYLTDHCIVTHNTLCALASVARLGRTTAVLVHKSFLMNQWVERIQEAFDIDPKDIGIVQQDVCDYKGKKIVLIMAQSLLSSREYPEDMYSYFGTVVVDEVHRFGAVEFRKAITKFPAKYRIGVTATPKRKDGLEEVFFMHIGEIAFVGAKRSLTAKIQYVNANMVITDSMRRGMLNWKKQYDMNKVTQYIVDCETRNRQIVKLLIDALKAGRKVMVLSSRREHLNVLHDMFAIETAKQQVRFTQGFYVGGMAEKDLRITATRHLILATFQMAQEGLDIPELDTLFLATPKGDIVQAVGRILRKHDGKKAPMVLDILDNDIPLCANLAKKRAKQYREMGCTF
jgi:intein/homing endonuclease